MGEGPVVSPKADAEPGVVGSRHRRRAELLMEGTTGVGVAAEEEEVREEGEGHARRTKGQNQRCHWYDVWERSFFSILAPPDAHRVDEGRWGW